MRKLLLPIIILLIAAAVVVISNYRQPTKNVLGLASVEQNQNKNYPNLIWLSNPKASPYTIYSYAWQQTNPTQKAEIKVSCLGHYQLLLNKENVYRGPSFAVPPKIYYDTIDISKKINLGINRLDIICNYLKEEVHEHPQYKFNAVLVGGKIEDGDRTHFLADQNSWLSAPYNAIKNGGRIATTAGFAEIVNLTQENYDFQTPTILDLPFTNFSRPLPLLVYEPVNFTSLLPQVYDLGVFMPVYLKVETNFENYCQIKFIWGESLNDKNEVIPYFNQIDEVTFPKNKITWYQFGRRTGRFLQLKSKCDTTKINLEIERVSMPFDLPSVPNLSQEDQKVFAISVNTLKNNIQDHFEDSLERERALYTGDIYAISQCLPSTDINNKLIKEMILRIVDSQQDDGIVKSPLLSENSQIIPAYSLLWISLANLYINRTQDLEFAKTIYPKIEKALDWAGLNESPDGFLYNKNWAIWWNFVDWTPTDDTYKFSTTLQFFYFDSLKNAADIARILGKDFDKYIQKSMNLKGKIYRYAFAEDKGLFSDSFEGVTKSKTSLLTNALAGKYNLFIDKEQSFEAFRKFDILKTYTPYSQAWVVEWLLNAGDVGAANKAIRDYWGAMVRSGATSVYEGFSQESAISHFSKEGYPIVPNSSLLRSASHGWGCGPAYLYNLIASYSQ